MVVRRSDESQPEGPVETPQLGQGAVVERSAAGSVGPGELRMLQHGGENPCEPSFRQQHAPRNTEPHPSASANGRQGIYAALDLGTNNCRLLVARPSRRGFMVIDAFSRIIRLGEGMSASGRLGEAAMGRTWEALKICAAKMHRRGVSRSRLVATEACRAAANGPEFIERVNDELGLSIEILSREAEARLAVSGCASLLDPESDLVLVFDIGGGSSEIVWLDLSRRKGDWRRSRSGRLDAMNCIAAWTSLPVGVVTLAER